MLHVLSLSVVVWILGVTMLGWSMKTLERVGSHVALNFIQSLWYVESVLAELYLWCSCAISLILLLEPEGGGVSCWTRLRGSVRYIRVFLWEMVEVFGCFLSYVINSFM